MSRSENALFNKGEEYIKSKTFERNMKKVGDKFGFEPVKPKMVPVYIRKNLKRYLGVCHWSHITISHSHWKHNSKKNVTHTLRHEIVHLFVGENYKLVTNNDKVSYKEFEKTCFVAFNHVGEHDAYQYLYTCPCGGKIKSTKNKQCKLWCRNCGKQLVSKREYNKLVKIAEINSKVVKVDINLFRVYEKTERIEV